MKATVIKDFVAEYPDPFYLKKGDIVSIGKAGPEDPRWVWCTNDYNKSRWIAESFIDISGNTGVMNRDYSSVELSVSTGEKLEVLEEEAGWYYCRNSSEREGWVPKDNVELE